MREILLNLCPFRQSSGFFIFLTGHEFLTCNLLPFRLVEASCSDFLLLGRRSLATDRRRLHATPSGHYLLDSNALVEAPEWVLTLKLLKLHWRVLVQELIDGEITTSDLDQDLAALDLDADTLRAKFVDTVSLAHEHDLELVAVGVVVDVLCKLHVDGVGLDRDVDSDAGLKVDDVSLERLNLTFQVLYLLQQLEAGTVGLEALKFDALNVGRGRLELPLHLILVIKEALVIFLE